jgi:UPF0755 protein
MPNTYQFRKGGGARDAITKMLNSFRDQVLPGDITLGQHIYGSFYKAVIMASIVQREAGTDRDRGLIAGVYLNRLQHPSTFPHLDADPTVQYAIGKPGNWWPAPTQADLRVKSVFNTYVIVGLPPKPIANPIEKSIRAAVHPTPSQYYYFCHRPGTHGASVFSHDPQPLDCPGTPQ